MVIKQGFAAAFHIVCCQPPVYGQGRGANSAPAKTRGTGKGTLLQSERNQLEPSRQTATHQLDRALLVRLSLSVPHEKRTPARVSPDRRRRTAREKPLTGNRKKPPKSPSSPDSTPAAVQQQPRRPGLKTGTPWRKIPGDVLAPGPIANANTTTKEGSEIKAGLPVEWKPISDAFCPQAGQPGSHATTAEEFPRSAFPCCHAPCSAPTSAWSCRHRTMFAKMTRRARSLRPAPEQPPPLEIRAALRAPLRSPKTRRQPPTTPANQFQALLDIPNRSTMPQERFSQPGWG